jgi:hypothetical protein
MDAGLNSSEGNVKEGALAFPLGNEFSNSTKKALKLNFLINFEGSDLHTAPQTLFITKQLCTICQPTFPSEMALFNEE